MAKKTVRVFLLSRRVALAVGAVLAWKEKGLLTVAMAACVTVFLAERLL